MIYVWKNETANIGSKLNLLNLYNKIDILPLSHGLSLKCYFSFSGFMLLGFEFLSFSLIFYFCFETCLRNIMQLSITFLELQVISTDAFSIWG